MTQSPPPGYPHFTLTMPLPAPSWRSKEPGRCRVEHMPLSPAVEAELRWGERDLLLLKLLSMELDAEGIYA